MNRRAVLLVFAAFAAFPVVSALAQTPATDPLPSWNDTATKNSIVTFVERVTKQGSPDLVPPAERIATFDQGRHPVGGASNLLAVDLLPGSRAGAG